LVLNGESIGENEEAQRFYDNTDRYLPTRFPCFFRDQLRKKGLTWVGLDADSDGTEKGIAGVSATRSPVPDSRINSLHFANARGRPVHFAGTGMPVEAL
jgi:hypothetical protein